MLNSMRGMDESSLHERISIMNRFNWWRRRYGIKIRLIYDHPEDDRDLFAPEAYNLPTARLFLNGDRTKLFIKKNRHSSIIYIANFDGSMHTLYYYGAIGWEFV